jgi:hypothetical protein
MSTTPLSGRGDRMREKKHGPLYPAKVLFPVTLPSPAKRRRIERAVTEVVSRMRPQGLCWCGKFCATDRKLRSVRDV